VDELTTTSRTSRGTAALTLRDGDRMADMDILKEGILSNSTAGRDDDDAINWTVCTHSCGEAVVAGSCCLLLAVS
jgi:hypothetical protein